VGAEARQENAGELTMINDSKISMTLEKKPLSIPFEVGQNPDDASVEEKHKIEFQDYSLYYGKFKALGSISMHMPVNKITAIIGPSGCGKSTLLRSINRMNDLVPNVKTEGQVLLGGENIFSPGVDVVDLRRRVGMVFQRPNPFPKSIYDNVAYGPRLYGISRRDGLDEMVYKALKQSALWEEVKDKLHQSAMALSGGQQQRLCIARALAVEPEVILMDEPASALDPVATLKIEELMQTLKETYTIIIVTHNMQQAARVSDFTAFMMIDSPETRTGVLVEYGPTAQIFTNPTHKQTEDYVTGRFG
jgi:phosphate transport system ATP-binding protein